MKNRRMKQITAAMAAASLIIGLQTVRANDGTEAAQQNAVNNSQLPAGSADKAPPSPSQPIIVQSGEAINEAAGAQAMDPASFLQATCHANKAEIEMGQLAEEKGQSRQVKMLAKHLVRDHQAVEGKLRGLAQGKNIHLVSQLDTKHQHKVDELSALSGAAFDRQFLDDQVKGHQKLIALFQQAAASNSDSDVRSFAQSNLPTLQHHLQMAEKDASIINEPAGAGKDGAANK